MPVSAAFRDYVADLFAPFGAIVFKRFFGGVGLYFKGRLFGFIMRDHVYLKTNDATRADFEAEGAEPFTFKKAGETIATGYYELPARLHEDAEELGRWVRRAHETALATGSSRKKSARKNAPPPELPLVAPRRKKK